METSVNNPLVASSKLTKRQRADMSDSKLNASSSKYNSLEKLKEIRQAIEEFG
jgi:hypothetical protein